MGTDVSMGTSVSMVTVVSWVPKSLSYVGYQLLLSAMALDYLVRVTTQIRTWTIVKNFSQSAQLIYIRSDVRDIKHPKLKKCLTRSFPPNSYFRQMTINFLTFYPKIVMISILFSCICDRWFDQFMAGQDLLKFIHFNETLGVKRFISFLQHKLMFCFKKISAA